MHGKITETGLMVSAEPLDGYKPITYADIPSFDQYTQGVRQAEPVDMGDYIYVGVEVYDLPPQEDAPIESPSFQEETRAEQLTLDERVAAVEEKTDEIIEIVEALV